MLFNANDMEEESFALWDFEEDEGEEEINLINSIDSAMNRMNDIEIELGIELPDEFCCPLTLECYRDPVRMVEDQQIYEREAIELWFQRGTYQNSKKNV